MTSTRGRLLARPDLRSVAGFPGYTVDEDGTVYGKRSGEPLKARIVRGEPCVDLTPRDRGRESPWVPVSILVARAWVPIPRPLYRHREVVHRDGNRRNCSASNLMWKRGPKGERQPTKRHRQHP